MNLEAGIASFQVTKRLSHNDEGVSMLRHWCTEPKTLIKDLTGRQVLEEKKRSSTGVGVSRLVSLRRKT